MKIKLNELRIRTISALIMAAIFLGCYCFSAIAFTLFLILGIAWILWFEWPNLCPVSGIQAIIFTALYPITPFIMLIHIHQKYRAQNLWIPLLPFIIAISYDTVAYLVGTLWGSHKICPRISPQKSWEGLIAGGCAVFTSLLFLVQQQYLAPLTITKIALYTLLFTPAAFFGDLFESYLKRRAGIKDTARILPGHGGILDRVDAVLGVTILFWIILLIRF